jgi:Dyp-type peroxidase family
MPLQPSDVQGNIFPGFKKDHQAFLFVRFPGTTLDLQARAWLAELRPSIAAADEVQAFNALYKIVHAHRPGRESEAVRATWVNVGFSFPGLHKLQTLNAADFPQAFTDGMHSRSAITGDVATEQSTWQIGGSDATLPDAIVVIAADVQTDLDSEIEHQRDMLLAHGLTEMKLFEGHSLGGGIEHFGFKDNITDPKPVEVVTSGSTTDDVLYSEFVLDPTRPNTPDPAPLDWMANGSYMVFRRLRQHVARFHERAWSAAAELSPLGGSGGAMLNGPLFEAKCFGRWPDGRPTDEGTAPPSDPSTDITAMTYINDKTGMKIPRFSHVRKSHPRNLGKDASGDDILGADTARNHRLIRRGITYGSFLPAGLPDDLQDRGLLFVAYQSSLSRQFELIMQQWLNNRGFPPLDPSVITTHFGDQAAGEDPIVGAFADRHQDPRLAVYPTVATPTGSTISLQIKNIVLERFVTMTGGGYFFSPGLASLAHLSGESV